MIDSNSDPDIPVEIITQIQSNKALVKCWTAPQELDIPGRGYHTTKQGTGEMVDW